MAKKWTVFGRVASLLVIYMAVEFSTGLVITPEERNLLVALGSKQELKCSLTVDESERKSQIYWTGPRTEAKFSTQDIPGDSLTITNILTIDSFSEDHVGTYECRYNDQEISIELVIVTENKTESEFFYGNKSVTLACSLILPGSSSVKATFWQWLRNGIRVLELDAKRFKADDSGTLVITNPARSDSGVYSARFNITDISEPTYDCDVTLRASPLVLDMAKSKNIVEGDTLDLNCIVYGYPPANITWYKDEKVIIKDGSHINISAFRGLENARLSVSSVSSYDEGIYKCVAVDDNGHESSKSITVRVKDRLEWLWPVIGIICEAAVLAIIIFACSKIKTDDHIEKPADEREGLLRQGSARNRDQEKNN